ncbi:alpha/beta hydrolase [Ammoniphilus sp. 3BR4]|uniref:alpha/beta hydrolase n=1 Tax=Ammoniphilus sp. 3BR4 TaxID=3158265 RepID=UPI003466AD4E
MKNLDPEAQLYLQAFNLMPAIHSMSPKEARDMLAKIPRPSVELDPLSKVEERMVPVGDDTQIKIRIYTPEGQGPFPLFVYFHGGGWVLGNLDTSDPSCRMIANRVGCLVISVDYRLAPEHSFPIPTEDAYKALEWVKEHAASLNGDVTRIVVGGDSAGGNLAAVVSMMTRDRQGPSITAQVLIYPVTGLDFNTGSYHEFKKGFGLDRDLMVWFGSQYVTTEEDKRHPYAAPLTAEDLSQLPPTLVITAENDVLRDEGLAYVKRLESAGVPVEYSCEQGMVHGYFTNMVLFSGRIQSSISKISRFLTSII